MPFQRLRTIAIAGWIPFVFALALGRTMLLGGPIQPGEIFTWSFIGCAPIALTLFVLRRTPDQMLAAVPIAPDDVKNVRRAVSSATDPRR